jgi:NADH-quinone oxidoreductase subunit H
MEQTATTLVFDMVFMPLTAFVVGLGLVYMMRIVRARIERRIGPVLLQPLYDIVKLYSKQTQISHGYMHDIALVMLLGGYIAAMLFLPVPGMNGMAGQADLITLMYLLMVPMLGMALGVGQCANPNGSIGISRALSSMLAYDVPYIIVIAGAAMVYSSTNLLDIIAYQQQHGWGLFTMPLLAIAGLIAMHAMLGKEPFEIYVAPSEIATGPMVEMSGKYMGALFVMQCFQLYTVGVLYTILFLGGADNWFIFLIKVFAVIFISVTITNLFGRLRTDDVIRWQWTYPTGIALLGLAVVMA